MCFYKECRGLAKSMVEKLQILRCSAYENLLVDVKEGEFAVYSVDNEGELHRFVASLGCLDHPEFVRLLKMVAEEFGFEGTLIAPCQPWDLQRILSDQGMNRPYVVK